MAKVTLDQKILAVIDRDKGMAYTEVLERHSMSPGQFHLLVSRKWPMEEIISHSHDQPGFMPNEDSERLKAIAADPERRNRLLIMEDWFLRQQYDEILAGKRRGFINGTLCHPENVENIVYYALTKHNPDLGSDDRNVVVRAALKIKSSRKFFEGLKLNGIFMKTNPETGKNYTHYDFWRMFDRAFQRITGNASLYSEREVHLHDWGDNGKVPTCYLKDRKRAAEMAYHKLTEAHPMLASPFREDVMAEIGSFPGHKPLFDYLRDIGLDPLLKDHGHNMGGSPLAVFQMYDEEWREQNKERSPVSIFSLSHEPHYHPWNGIFKCPSRYWRENPEKADEAVYHILSKNCPGLGSHERSVVLAAMRSLPETLYDHLCELLPLSLIRTAFPNESQKQILRAYDRGFRAATGEQSLFSREAGDPLKFDRRGRLVRY